jgi:hypothetical protein
MRLPISLLSGEKWFCDKMPVVLAFSDLLVHGENKNLLVSQNPWKYHGRYQNPERYFVDRGIELWAIREQVKVLGHP